LADFSSKTQSRLYQEWHQCLSKPLHRRCDNVLLVNPEQFFRIERRCRLVDISDIEQVDHLRERKYLLVTVRPA
jgi:hypothetical protein